MDVLRIHWCPALAARLESFKHAPSATLSSIVRGNVKNTIGPSGIAVNARGHIVNTPVRGFPECNGRY